MAVWLTAVQAPQPHPTPPTPALTSRLLCGRVNLHAFTHQPHITQPFPHCSVTCSWGRLEWLGKYGWGSVPNTSSLNDRELWSRRLAVYIPGSAGEMGRGKWLPARCVSLSFTYIQTNANTCRQWKTSWLRLSWIVQTPERWRMFSSHLTITKINLTMYTY